LGINALEKPKSAARGFKGIPSVFVVYLPQGLLNSAVRAPKRQRKVCFSLADL